MSAVAATSRSPVTALVILSLLLFNPTAFACPGCTYERMVLTNWYQKVWIIKLSAALVFTFNRLDFVRVSYVFFAYISGYIWAYKYLIWFGHPAVSPEWVSGIALLGLGILELNIMDAALLMLLGALPFFRRDRSKGLLIWQPIAYAATVLIARSSL